MVAADYLVTGSCSISGKLLHVSARIVRVESGLTAAAVDMNGSIDSIFELQETIAYKLLAEFEKRSNGSFSDYGIFREDISKQKHSSMDEYRLYAMGLAAERTNPREALELFLKAIELNPDYFAAAAAAGQVYSDMEKFDDSLAYFSRARVMLEKTGETTSVRYAEILQNTAKILRYLNKKYEALELSLKSLAVFENLNRTESTEYAVLLNQIGVIYGDMKDRTKQNLFFKKSKTLFEKLGRENSIGYALVLFNTAADGSEEKLENLLHAKKILEDIGYTGWNYAKVLNRIGEEYDGMSLMANADKSLPFYLKGAESLEKRGQTYTKLYLDLLNNIGSGYLEKEKYCDALNILLKEKDISEKMNPDRNLEERRKKIDNYINQNNIHKKCGK